MRATETYVFMRLFVKNSIGSKILAAFLAMGAIAGIIGAYGYGVLSAAGDMVVQTYDGPLMSINFARAASLDFAQMENHLLQRRLAAEVQKAAIDATIEETETTFFEDLGIARERSQAATETAIISEIESLVRQWEKVRLSAGSDPGIDDRLESLGKKIMDKFDALIELSADLSFVGRRKAVWAISYYKYTSIGATLGALLLAFAITLLLARKIVRPLAAAASVADHIAGGELQTPIPTGAKDETGVLLRSMTVMQDNIREMVERETARAHSAEVRLTEALENSGEGVLLVGARGDVVLANGQISRFFPKLPGKLSGLPFDTVLRLFNETLVTDQEALPDSAAAIEFSTGVALSAERRLADGRWVRFDKSPTSEGGFIVLLSDFTEIKNREVNFQRAQRAAEEASAAKSRFLANMSHELRTPLNAIIGFSEIIASQLFGKIENARYVNYATDILRSGRHLLDVINDVLELSRSEVGKIPFDAKPVDLRYVLLDCAKMLNEQCIAGELTLIVPELREPVFALGEKAKLRQIFLNLLSNAVKFTERGGTISIGLRLEDADAPDCVWVSIADTGIGMSPDDIRVALTPFGQVDNRLERRYEGTGLGLPLTQALTDLHGGLLKIESEPGRGTVVGVRLPKAKTQLQDEKAGSESITA
jgi:signal transduction histidine kinase/HAMP domain-containing protein